MFKTAVITDEITQDFSHALEIAKKHGLDAVEVRSVYELGAFEWTDEAVDKMKSLSDQAGLPVCCVSSPFFKCEIDDAKEIESQYESLRRCIGHAHKLGAKLIRGFTFWDKGGFEARLPEIVERFQKVIQILQQEGMTMALESEPSVYAANAAKLARILDAINSPYVKALWDPGNSIYDPSGEVPYPDGYGYIKDKLAHVHLKDAKVVEGKATGTPISKGDVDLVGQFKALIQDGYTGYVSLETHYRPAHHIAEELLAMPKGSAFSHGGLEATEESLVLWRELLSRIES